jgi:prepilin-type N-terminal cleavage/methylation domain-containing protein
MVKKREGGYTLVELLITIALTGLVFTIAGGALYQLSTASGSGNSRLTILHEMQNSAHWLNNDGKEASAAVGGSSLTLTIPNSNGVTYNLSGNNLQRISGTSTLILARNITGLSFSVQNRLITMNITAAISGRSVDSVQGEYKVNLRSQP